MLDVGMASEILQKSKRRSVKNRLDLAAVRLAGMARARPGGSEAHGIPEGTEALGAADPAGGRSKADPAGADARVLGRLDSASTRESESAAPDDGVRLRRTQT